MAAGDLARLDAADLLHGHVCLVGDVLSAEAGGFVEFSESVGESAAVVIGEGGDARCGSCLWVT